MNAYQQKWHIEVGLQSTTASLSSDCQTGGDGGEVAISSPLGMHNLASGLEGLDGPTLRIQAGGLDDVPDCRYGAG